MRGLRNEDLVVDLGVRGDGPEVGELDLFEVFPRRVWVLAQDGDLEGLTPGEALLYEEDA